MRAIRLGRASIRCASCRAVVAEYTETLSPPSSWASAPHSGSQAKMLSAAAAGSPMDARLSAVASFRTIFMFAPLEFVGAVRAQTHDVLEEYLVVGRIRARLVLGGLQADAAEFAGAPVQHDRLPGRVVGRENRKIRRGERSGVHHADVCCAGVQPVITVPDAPHRNELIDPLQVQPRLRRGVGSTLGSSCRRCRGVEAQVTVLAAPEILAL